MQFPTEIPHRRLGRALRGLVLSAALALAAPAASGERDAEPGAFDFYVLSLSWSPSYCAVEGDDANPRQCARGRPYAFIVHGLWPQYEHGYPEFCASGEPDRVPGRLVEAYLDLMPSPALIGHQWRKHGACAGLSQADYFALVREARGRVAVPPDFLQPDAPLMLAPESVEQRFIDANPGLAPGDVAVTCGRRHLREVRICLTRGLAFRACPEVDRGSCRRDKVLMPPVR